MTAYLTIALVAANLIMSYKGFQDRNFTERYLFSTRGILRDKEYIRIFSAAFLHANWAHLLFNVIALYSFGSWIEGKFGPLIFGGIYLISLIASKALALVIHKNHPDYRALGASGAVSGIVFSYVMLAYPDGGVLLFFVIPVAGWLFAILYTLYTLYGVRSQAGKIGHEAHLGGSIIGIIAGVALRPSLLFEETWLVAALLVPIIVFFFLYYLKPEWIKMDNWRQGKSFSRGGGKFKRKPGGRYPANEYESLQYELDQLLEKVGKKGMDGLTTEERERLKRLSRIVNYKKTYTQDSQASDDSPPQA